MRLMEKIPISLIIDDPAPRVHVYREHAKSPRTQDGRLLTDHIPNDFLMQFCDIVDIYGLRGKFSIIPMPGCRGDIVNGVDGFPYAEIEEWLNIVKARLTSKFSFCPEMLTHHKAVNLKDGGFFEINEMMWAASQTRETLVPYIMKALSLLRAVGIRAVGVTSPWLFGIEVEDAYAAAISDAVCEVWGVSDAWYFLRSLHGVPDARPWIAFEAPGRRVVSIPATLNDEFWQTIECPDTSEAYVYAVADRLLSADGQNGAILDALAIGAWPILITHWQSLFSNGNRTGLHALSLVSERIRRHLPGRVVWRSFEEIMAERQYVQ